MEKPKTTKNPEHILTNADLDYVERCMDEISNRVGYDVNELIEDYDLPYNSNKKQLLQPVPESFELSLTSNEKIQVEFIWEILAEVRSLMCAYKEDGKTSCNYAFTYQGYSKELRNPHVLFPHVKQMIENYWKNDVKVTINNNETITLNWTNK
jgi:hypothetical protein